ncbi:MAG: carbohydrate-binding protein, partial [Victivallales bacterium]|nr:carbohydrate-binding protein [Victivallales bacterium]
PAVKLPPYASEVWFIDGRTSEIMPVATTLRDIAGFNDSGRPLFQAQDYGVNKQLSAAPGKWFHAVDSSWMKKCFMPKWQCLGFNRERWIQATPGGEISYGTINFGNGDFSGIEINVAADPPRSGGTISFIAAETGSGHETEFAKIITPVTGDWFDFQTLKVPLAAKITGKRRVFLRFSGKGCNIRGWRLTTH